MKILVLAHPKDDHAAPIRWALEQAGYRAACWSGISWAEQDQASLLLDSSPVASLGAIRLEEDDVVWLRQPPHDSATGTSGKTSPAFPVFWDDIACTLETLPLRCINKFSASCLIRNKGVQLYLARASGLTVPATLLSNSPAAVRKFFDRNTTPAICKAFSSHIWQQGSGEIAVTETFRLDREQLPPEDEVFTYAPAIYQRMIRKQFDVRVVLMGERIHAFALHTSGNSLDWRYDAARKDLEVDIISTPPEVRAGILLLAQRAAICFGVMDFAVDDNHDWWFLEINEQGQFLWLDQFHPGAALQQKFCAFLTAPPGSPQSLEERQTLFPSLSEYQRSHQNEEAPDITRRAQGAAYRSMEP